VDFYLTNNICVTLTAHFIDHSKYSLLQKEKNPSGFSVCVV